MTCILKIVRGIQKTTHQEITKDILLLTLSQLNDNVNDIDNLLVNDNVNVVNVYDIVNDIIVNNIANTTIVAIVVVTVVLATVPILHRLNLVLQPTPFSHPQRSFFGMASAVRIMVGTRAPTTQAIHSVTIHRVTLDVQASNPILFVKTEVEDAQGKTISVDIKLPKLDGNEEEPDVFATRIPRTPS